MTVSSPPARLPAEAASFIGRDREVAEIRSLFTRTRILTLTGPGGSGKTRLALRVAADLRAGFPDGACLVQLAPLTDSTLVPRAVATALGVRGTAGRPLLATLVAALNSRRLLLVLDNCEHMIAAVASLVETLVAACPQLKILATSREPLRVAGEMTWRVPALSLPPEPLPSIEELSEVASVALFVERARARRPDFHLTQGNAAAVAAICRHLEGLPLAIELAAAQAGALTPAQIVDRLDDSLRLLEGGIRTVSRQETLRAALDWSYALLDSPEQMVFRSLAVFAGSFDVDAAEGVCSDNGLAESDVLGVLRSLVEKSLVEAQTTAAGVRYRLLEPIRQYARDLATGEDEMGKLQPRHAEYFVRMAEEAEPAVMSGDRGPWMERLAAEEDNLRAALDWSRRSAAPQHVELGQRLAGSLVFYWVMRGQISEGLDWLEAVLARGTDTSPAARARALYAACELGWHAGTPSRSRERAEESEALWRSLGDKRRLAYTLQSLPMTVDHPRAREAVAEALRLFAEIGDDWGIALATGAADIFPMLRDGDPSGAGKAMLEEGLQLGYAVGDEWLTAQRLNFLGDLDRTKGNDTEAQARYEEALDLLRRQGLTATVPSLLHNLGYVALHQGDTRRARTLFRESLALFRDQGDQKGMVDCLDGLAAVLVAIGQPRRAASLLGVTQAVREPAGISVWPANRPDYDRTRAAIGDALDEAEMAAALAEGRALPWHQVVAEALTDARSGASRAETDDEDLTPREREVATLVAQGLTNRQIGARLFITEGTARLHVKHILSKLGFTSRAQIAAWAVSRGLTPD